MTISPPTLRRSTGGLAAVIPGPPRSNGIHSQSRSYDNFLGKLDHRFGERDQFTARYSLYHVTSVNSRGAGGLSAPTASANLYNTDQTLAASNVLTLSPRVVNETRGQFSNSSLVGSPFRPDRARGKCLRRRFVWNAFGIADRTAEQADRDRRQFLVPGGSARSPCGCGVLYNDDTITYPRSYPWQLFFLIACKLPFGTYNNSGFTQTFNDSTVHQTNPNIGMYAQDEWKVNHALTLNIGIRYDLQFLKSIQTDTNIFLLVQDSPGRPFFRARR